MNKKVPVYVISGFLGSGKTTVLLHMLQHFKSQNKKPAVILNELGNENVEGHLFKDHKIVELLNGCICCTIQEDLKTTIKELNIEEIDVLLIEGTGVANPLEIKDAILDPLFIDKYELYSMVSIVDASHYLEYQSFFTSSKDIRELLKEQVVSASFLIINKIDLVTKGQLQKVEKKVMSELKKEVPIFQTSHGEAPLDLLLEKRIWVEEMTDVKVHTHKHHHHHHHIEAIKLPLLEPVSRTGLENGLKSLSKHVIRAKGIVRLYDNEKDLFEFQYAANQLRIKPMENKIGTIKECIILIGSKIPKEKVEKVFLGEIIK
ncbi:CobW family GTP-binding protein [Bacillus alkalisoli]|uniref:CobW family GTP-binding protein n=1 Tax=Bacillus alkalisoli TaxID=2011008 RepID=UPI000C240F62|nr:GTP-binding protein [Bacillus alkalisoli]